MALVVELADVDRVGHDIALLQIVEIIDRRSDAHPRQAFQVGLAAQELQVFAPGAPAAVAPAEREQAAVDTVLLHALVPTLDDLRGACHRVVVVAQMHQHPRAVDSLPAEGVVGERIATVVVPEYLRSGEVLHPAATHDLRHCARVAEHVRQPQHLAVDAQFLLEEPLAVDELADQALAAGHVRIRLDPHAALSDDAAGADGLLDAPVEVGVALPQDGVEERLALEEPVLRVFVHEGELIGERPANLAFAFLDRPQPGAVDVGMAEGEHRWRGAAVRALQQRAQALAGGAGRPQHVGARQLGVEDQREVAEPSVDLCHAQRVCVDAVAQFGQRFHVQPELVDLLLPDAEGASADRHLRRRRLGHGDLALDHRTGPLETPPLAGVGLDQDVVLRTCRRRVAKRCLAVRRVAGAAGSAVYENNALAAGFET